MSLMKHLQIPYQPQAGLICVHVQSICRQKGSTVGMQGLEGAEESQGHKVLGIHPPCLGPVRAQRGDLLSFALGQQGFEFTRAQRENIC